MGCCFQQKACNISEKGTKVSALCDILYKRLRNTLTYLLTKVTIDDQQEVANALSSGAKINDPG